MDVWFNVQLLAGGHSTVVKTDPEHVIKMVVSVKMYINQDTLQIRSLLPNQVVLSSVP